MAAEIMALTATLHLYRRRVDESLSLLDEALELCESRPDSPLRAQCLIQRSRVIAWWRNAEDAIPDLRASLDRLAGLDEPRLKLIALSNLAGFCALAGQVDEAECALEEAKVLGRLVGTSFDQHQLEWIEGLVKCKRGEEATAENLLQAARAGLGRLAKPIHKSIASLDLAALFQKQGRFEEVIGLVAEAIPALENFRHAPG